MYKNGGKTYEINDGEVSEIKKNKIRVCDNGKNLLKSKEEFPPPWKYACNGKNNFESQNINSDLKKSQDVQ